MSGMIPKKKRRKNKKRRPARESRTKNAKGNTGYSGIKRLKKDLDALYQEWGRKTYEYCILCGKTYCCLHHFVKKSQSIALRWDKENGVPICVWCHCRVHSKNDPYDTLSIVKKMSKVWGAGWDDRLLEKRHHIFKVNKTSLQEKMEELV